MVLLPSGGVRLALCSGQVRPEGRVAFPLARNEPYGNRTQSAIRVRVALDFCKSRRLDSQKRFAASGSESLRTKLAFLAGKQNSSF